MRCSAIVMLATTDSENRPDVHNLASHGGTNKPW